MQREIQTNKHWFKDLILACWGVLNFSRRVFLNLMFIVVVIVVVIIIGASAEKPIHIDDNSILKLNLAGHIVEQKTFVDPYDEFMSEAVGSKKCPT
jgi:protease-4